MPSSQFAGRWNLDLIDANYRRWQQDPGSVDDSWRVFFEGFELGSAQKPMAAESQRHFGIVDLIDAYRGQGHLLASLDPLHQTQQQAPGLEMARFGLEESELDRTFDTSHFLGGAKQQSLRELLAALRETYCRTIGVEYMHIQDGAIRRWLQ